MVAVNENIRFLRKKINLTQQQFADLIGIKRSLVGAYEEGRAEPRLINLSRMAMDCAAGMSVLMQRKSVVIGGTLTGVRTKSNAAITLNPS